MLNITKVSSGWWFEVAETTPSSCASPSQMTRFAGLCRVLNGPNRSMANAAAVLESVQPGQNYSFFRSAGGSPLCAAIDIVYGNATLADQFGLDQAWASPYAATVLAVTRIVNEGLGGSGYDESVAQFLWSLEMLGLAWQVIDNNPSLGAQLTGSQRAEVFKMFLKVLVYYTDAGPSSTRARRRRST
jgi:hypothetical protein